jgi:hypothetical protein
MGHYKSDCPSGKKAKNDNNSVGRQSGCVCPAKEYTRRAERARERVYMVELIVKDCFFWEKEK